MIVSSTAWEERRLCDDGGCTGLIGSDGVCRVCGRASKFWGDERRRGMQDDDGDEEMSARDGASSPTDADDEDERALCPDGSCTGLLDIDGRCKVCGKVDESVRHRVKAAPARDDGDGGDGADGGDEGDDGDDDDDRELCPDGGCTGLIGDDGACRVCGTRAEA
jgi:hypothetical protein